MCEHCCSSKGLNVFSHINAGVKVKVEYGAGGGGTLGIFEWRCSAGILEPWNPYSITEL